MVSLATGRKDVVNLADGKLHISVPDPDERGELHLSVIGEMARLLQAWHSGDVDDEDLAFDVVNDRDSWP